MVGQRMKILSVIFLFCSLSASAFAGQDEYNDCILTHLKGAKLDVAAGLLRNACYENYMGPFFPSDKVRQYNDCLLEYLVGVESFQAAMEIRNACGGKYLR